MLIQTQPTSYRLHAATDVEDEDHPQVSPGLHDAEDRHGVRVDGQRRTAIEVSWIWVEHYFPHAVIGSYGCFDHKIRWATRLYA